MRFTIFVTNGMWKQIVGPFSSHQEAFSYAQTLGYPFEVLPMTASFNPWPEQSPASQKTQEENPN